MRFSNFQLYKFTYLFFFVYFIAYYFLSANVNIDWILYRRGENIIVVLATVVWLILQFQVIKKKEWRRSLMLFLVHLPFFLLLGIVLGDIKEFGLIL